MFRKKGMSVCVQMATGRVSSWKLQRGMPAFCSAHEGCTSCWSQAICTRRLVII